MSITSIYYIKDAEWVRDPLICLLC